MSKKAFIATLLEADEYAARGRSLKRLLKAKDLTATSAAERLGVSAATVRTWVRTGLRRETDKPTTGRYDCESVALKLFAPRDFIGNESLAVCRMVFHECEVSGGRTGTAQVKSGKYVVDIDAVGAQYTVRMDGVLYVAGYATPKAALMEFLSRCPDDPGFSAAARRIATIGYE